jgi:LmbE family N-acetylglucosaminyl deacetylase
MHSTYSYDGTLTLKEIKNELLKYNISICFMTEHAHKGMTEEKYDTFVEDCNALSDVNFKMIPGLEYNSSDGPHILVPSLYKFVQKTGNSVKEISEFAKKQNTISILAHPKRQSYQVEQYLDIIDGIEIINTNYEKIGNIQHKKYFEKILDERLLKLFGLDMHLKEQFKDLSSYVNIIKSQKNIKDISIEDIKNNEIYFKNQNIKEIKGFLMFKQVVKELAKKYLRFFIYKKYINFFKKNYLQKSVIYPFPLNIEQTDKILILSPHPDDESIGCGGLLLKYSTQCKVICLTDGRLGDSKIKMNELIKKRKEEFIEAMDYIKINNYKFLNIKDGNLINEFDSFNEINFDEFDYIFIPNVLDQHPDHKAVGIHLTKKLQSEKSKAKICMYEVWNALSLPNSYINISDIVEKKKELVSLYESQTKHIDYQNRIISLNNYRGMSVGVDYAEVYSCMECNDFLEMMK